MVYARRVVVGIVRIDCPGAYPGVFGNMDVSQIRIIQTFAIVRAANKWR